MNPGQDDRGQRGGQRRDGTPRQHSGGQRRQDDRRDDRRGGGQRRDGQHSGQRGGGPRRRIDPARAVAYDVLRRVDTGDAYANLILPGRLERAELSGRDAAFATELTYGALRGLGLYDPIIDHIADHREIDPPVRDALRLGAHQLLAMRVPAHAAVAATVDLVAARCGQGASKFANAVLRRMAGADREAWIAELSAGLDAITAASLRHSHPKWIVRALGQALTAHGRQVSELEDLLVADNEPPEPVLVALPGLSSPADLPGEPTAYSPLAHRASGDPARVRAIATGRARVQDEGSQLVALALAEAPLAEGATEGRWLDLCAGPGGKAALLAALAGQRDTGLDAVEIAQHRAALVAEALRPLEGTTIITGDGREIGDKRPGAYSRVLVDAPCTGLGALRRRPESRWRRRPADLPELAPLQRDLLASGWRALAPGGVLAYATCSPHIAETLAVVDDFLGRHRDAEVLDAPAIVQEITGADAEEFAGVGRGEGRTMQLWPHRHRTDAMFLTLFRRPREG